ncbi:MAG TPA: glycolate oxidase subunit GlcF [Leucothrix sp.]|nr:glycolate oxidase subunit GlcF [Leucothrix sp.]
MKTDLKTSELSPEDAKTAEKILQTCVHCGFCNATCPTYQLIGDENDGPRGRIYLIKQMLEGKEASESTRTHLDRCLTCRNCETTCPSGVEYAQLLDIGRKIIDIQSPRNLKNRLTRKALRLILPHPKRFSALLKTGQLFKSFLPSKIKKKIPRQVAKGKDPITRHKRRMIILEGCVQPSISPDINQATTRVLHKLGISVLKPKNAGCCGAVSQHLSAEDEALEYMKRNIDAWWVDIESGAEAIIITASGCGVMVKEYAHYLRNDPDYAEKAQRVSTLCKDISEVLISEDLSLLGKPKKTQKISWHPPCTLQHGQKITGVVEKILIKSGYKLPVIRDQHLCCGSAGTYSILQPVISEKLQINKITALLESDPELIVTANIGCQTHLQEASKVPVIHWIHLLDSV